MYYLYSELHEKKVSDYGRFDHDKVKEDIINWFRDESNAAHDCLHWCKEYYGTETIGDTIIDFYEVRESWIVKLVFKGNKTYYRKLWRREP